MAQAANKTCEICIRASGLHYCTQCDQIFCDDCKMSHLRLKLCRNHIFLSGPNINMEKKVGGCKVHNEDFVYLCEDCDQLICRLCVTKTHQKHYLVDIKDSNNKVQTEISKYLDSKVNNISSSAKLIEGKLETYKIEVEATVKVIIEHGNLIKIMVNKKVDALIKALRERERTELQSLSKTNTDCTKLLGEATRQQNSFQDMIKQCDEVSLFHTMMKIKSDIDNLKTVNVISLPSATYNGKHVIFSDVETLFGNLTLQ